MTLLPTLQHQVPAGLALARFAKTAFKEPRFRGVQLEMDSMQDSNGSLRR